MDVSRVVALDTMVDMKRYVISYFIALLATVISVILGFDQEGNTALLLTLCAPIVLFLMADKVTSALSYRAEARRQRDWLSQVVPTIAAFRVFPNSRAAFEYLKSNLCSARRILNTRVGIREAGESAVSSVQTAFDRLVKRALVNGVHYSVVVSQQYDDHRTALQEYVDIRKPLGQLRSGVLDVNTPVINFIVLEREHASEVVFGWVVTRNYDHTKPVFLSRDERLVEFFASYHDSLIAQKK